MKKIFVNKDSLLDFFVTHFTELTKKGYLQPQSEIKKIPNGLLWYRTIIKGKTGFKDMADFCSENGIKRRYNKFDPNNIEKYINEHIVGKKGKEKILKETALKKNHKDFYNSLINGNIPGYNGYFDLVQKKGLKVFIEKKRLSEEIYFNEIFEKFISPLIYKNTLKTKTLNDNNYQNFYRALNEGIVKGYKSYSDFKMKHNLN